MKTRQGRTFATLDDVLKDAEAGGFLANVRPAQPAQRQGGNTTVNSFLEILDFTERAGREPRPGHDQEAPLAERLATFRSQPALRAMVLAYDTAGLLADDKLGQAPPPPAGPPAPAKEFTSLDDILENDELGLLEGIDASPLRLEHVPRGEDREAPEEVACRQPCEDFHLYEGMFRDLQEAIRTKAVGVSRFSREGDVIAGNVFVLRGLLCYVDRVLKATGDPANPRLRVIFDNGLESDPLKLSLSRALYKDPHGKYVDFRPNLFTGRAAHITAEDRPTGYLYVLASGSKAPALASLINSGHLVKIGFSTQEVEERVKNAESEPTYLEAPVRVLHALKCYNLDPQKFERLVHAFLHFQRLSVTLTSRDGRRYQPREWFTVDGQTALSVCQHIIDGDIQMYRMDNTSGKMVRKNVDIQD